jgi:CubicO group peptidase (beta-lactamase class C family)
MVLGAMRREPAAIVTASELLVSAVAARTFPAAVAEVGSANAIIWRRAFGSPTADDGASADEGTIFDLASLTKPLATTSVILDLMARHRLQLEQPVAVFFEEWRGSDREGVTVQDLLEHSSGLSARLLDRPPDGRRGFEHEICTMPLEYAPRTRAIYSDLGFILLGFLAERVVGSALDEQVGALFDRIGASSKDGDLLVSRVGNALRPRIAPTSPLPEDERRGRLLIGEVHDNYAAQLGGFAGHAGLFGTAGSVGFVARRLLDAARGRNGGDVPFTPDLVRRAVRRSTVPGSSRALGWDTMLPTSSCGTQMSASAFGHVGFTGTALWIVPDRDRYYVLLTNRVCGGGSSDDMQRVRRAFHDALATL